MRRLISLSFIVLASLVALILNTTLSSSVFTQEITQKDRLQELSQLFADRLEAQRSQMYYNLLRSNALPQRQLNEDPDIQLMYINEIGHPVYYMVENATSKPSMG